MTALDTATAPPGADAPLFGLIAAFSDPAAISAAAERVRDAGYSRWDVYAPIPIHGINEAMGLKPSKVSYFVGAGAAIGVGGAMLMQWWMSAVDYRIVTAGKPYFAWEQFLVITFELAVLLGAIGAIVGMFVLNGLPRPHHPTMTSEQFLRVSDDRFVIAIEAADPRFDESETRRLLESIGGTEIEAVRG